MIIVYIDSAFLNDKYKNKNTKHKRYTLRRRSISEGHYEIETTFQAIGFLLNEQNRRNYRKVLRIQKNVHHLDSLVNFTHIL
jgi:hypothetical protein